MDTRTAVNRIEEWWLRQTKTFQGWNATYTNLFTGDTHPTTDPRCMHMLDIRTKHVHYFDRVDLCKFMLFSGSFKNPLTGQPWTTAQAFYILRSTLDKFASYFDTALLLAPHATVLDVRCCDTPEKVRDLQLKLRVHREYLRDLEECLDLLVGEATGSMEEILQYDARSAAFAFTRQPSSRSEHFVYGVSSGLSRIHAAWNHLLQIRDLQDELETFDETDRDANVLLKALKSVEDANDATLNGLKVRPDGDLNMEFNKYIFMRETLRHQILYVNSLRFAHLKTDY